ncbi:hypothetical protein HDU67_009609 [Dinochytrium kinnereticum]|nr:hypothetical protein HDU67_009609 [Dinochytrium kinnereticum]
MPADDEAAQLAVAEAGGHEDADDSHHLAGESQDRESLNAALELNEVLTARVYDLNSLLQSERDNITAVRKQLAEEEEKKNKSIQLLRSSKARILKLEEALKVREGEAGQIALELSQVRASTASELSEVKASASQLAAELAEYRDSAGAQLAMWQQKIAELEHRSSELEAELETSRRLFEVRSAELDSLKLKCSEMERSAYETEQTAAAHSEEAGFLRREVDRLRREAVEKSKDVRSRDDEIRELLRRREEITQDLDAKTAELAKERADMVSLTANLSALEAQHDEWNRRIIDTEERNEALEETLKKALLDKVQEIEAKEKILEELKARENHLLKINKALKEEVRKLSRAMGIGTPLSTTPPLSARPSIIDPNDIAAAQKQSTSRRASSSSLGSSASQAVSPILNPSSIPPTYPTGSSSSTRGSQHSLEEAANLEYLKNLVLKFVESKKEKRMQMIPALSMLLKLSPEETRRVQKNA